MYFLCLTLGTQLAIFGASDRLAIADKLFRALDAAEPGVVIEVSVVRDGVSRVLGSWAGEGARLTDPADVFEALGLAYLSRAS